MAKSIEEDYRIGQTIGIGAFSYVKKGMSKDDDSIVAIKVFKMKTMKDKEIDQVYEEVKILEKL